MTEFGTITEYLRSLALDDKLAVITTQMAADALGVTRAAIDRQIKEDRLVGIKIGGTKCVSADAVSEKLRRTDREAAAIRKRLEDVAHIKQVVEYGALMGEFGMNSTLSPDRRRMGMLLGKVSRQTQTELGFLLSALVVNARSQMPSDAFFGLADDIDHKRYQKAKSEKHYLDGQLAAIHNHYA